MGRYRNLELTDLVKTPGESVYPVYRDWMIPTKEVKGQYQIYTYFPYEKEREFELYVMEIEPDCSYISGAHGENTKEYIMVKSGKLKLRVDKESYIVKAGDAIRFDSDKEHEYYNAGDEKMELICVFSYSA